VIKKIESHSLEDYLIKEKHLQNENGIVNAVREIIQAVKDSGNEPLLRFINKYEEKELRSIDEVIFNQNFLEDKFNSLNDKDRNMLVYMANRIEKFHNKDIRLFKEFEDDSIEKYGYFLRPIEKVGLYAPGGKAQYPSSVLMTGVLAKLAGVNEITVMFPGKKDDLNLMFAASHLIGAKRVLNSGGAHTLAAVAFGTQSINRVDKIFGPGNSYVSEAKRQLYGEVGIDSLNGPSEVAIIVDQKSSIEYAVKDFLAQAEHGEDSRCFLIHLPGFNLNQFNESLKKNLSKSKRKKIINEALKNCCSIEASSLDNAISLSNLIIPEHLEILIDDIDLNQMPEIRAGAVFIGIEASAVMGDYCAGPSHVIPTGGQGRFSSQVSLNDFYIKTSFMVTSKNSYKKNGYKTLLNKSIKIAESEGLWEHANALKERDN
jgi:histidinol dehydrogenase